MLAATDATRAGARRRDLTRYAADLVVPPRARAEVALLKAVALRYVMSDRTGSRCRPASASC